MVPKVLFVGDEAYAMESLKNILRKEPYEMLVANSANEALEILAKKPVDIVVSVYVVSKD